MTLNLEEKYYDRIIEENIPVTLYLENGVQITGMLLDYDEFSLTVETGDQDKQQMVLKQGITTVEPAEKVEDYFPEEY